MASNIAKIEKIDVWLPLSCWTVSMALEFGYMVVGIEDSYLRAIMM